MTSSLAVVGPGAMGCLLAARLALAGNDVVLLDHDAERAARIADRGLRLFGLGEQSPRTVPVRAQVLPLEHAPEAVFLCVKAPATESAVASLRSLGCTVAVLQNGLGRFEAVGELLGAPERVVGVLTTEGATRSGEGEVRHAGAGETLVGPLLPEGLGRAKAIVARLEQAGFNALLAEDLQRACWEKAVVNAAINALTALLDCPNGDLLRASTASQLADRAAVEAAGVAQALGVAGDWSEAAARARWRAVAEATRDNVSSTLADLRRGHRTEVFAINGAVAQTARELGLSAYVNETLDLLVAAREALIQPSE